MESMNVPRMMEALVARTSSPFPIQRQYCVVPNVSEFLPWEADLLVVSRNGFLSEVEIKISLSDWKADAHKTKWGNDEIQSLIRRFYYAAPMRLAERFSEVWTAPGSGVFGVVPDGRWRLLRQPEHNLQAKKLEILQMAQLARLGGMKFWSSLSRWLECELA